MLRKPLFLIIVVMVVASCDSVNKIFSSSKDIPDETKPNIELESEEPQEADTIPDVEPKVKRNVFYDIKTKKGFTRNDTDREVIFELFHYIKEPTKVDNYVREVYHFPKDRNQITRVLGKGQTLERVLHGPYKRTVNNIVVEEGMFYNGTKHEIWLNQRMDSTLYDKEHFHQGWYRDSQITYYDEATKEKIKEVIPIRYGKKEGQYYLFHPDGSVAVTGRYEFDQKVGIWSEYYYNPQMIRPKKEIQYPQAFHMKYFKPYIRKEWKPNGSQIYTAPQLDQ